ncbi:MAG TPA: translocation/assembly module TamB domain-containing protein [Patescibacteria group bacterium]|nr:translocation/assembly module TamB domain-containing protein [Patescibacteria group bacterium]
MQVLRIGLITVGWVVLSLAAVAAGLIGGLQTGLGQEWLAAAVNRGLSDDIQVSGLSGSIPWEVTIGAIDLRDVSGSWGRIETARCKLNLADVLRGRVTVALLSADKVVIARLPQASSEAAAAGNPLRGLNAIQLQRLEVPLLELAPPVLGTQVTLALAGEATVGADQSHASLTVKRIDGQSLSGSAAFDFAAAGPLEHAPIAVSGEGRLHVGAAETGFDWHVRGSSTLQGSAVAISELTVEGQGLTMTAQGAADLDQQTVAAAVHLAASDLAPLTAVAGWPLGGRASLDGTLSGPVISPRLDGVLTAEDVTSDGRRLDRLTARVHTIMGAPLAVEADGDFRSGPLAGTLNGRAALGTDGNTLDLTSFHMAASGTTLDAALRMALDTGLTSGRVTARSADLSPWSSLAGAPLSGRFDLDARLAARRGQDVTASLSASQLALASTTAQRVTANGTVSDLWGAAAGRGDLSVLGVKLGGVSFAQIRASVRSRHPRQFAVTANLRGQYKGPLTLVAAGDASITGSVVSGRLVTLQGSFANQGFRLDQPLRFSGTDKQVSVAALDLDLGGGRITGAATLAPDRVMARLAARNLPVAMAKAFSDAGVNGGAFDADITLQGPVERPDGDITLATRGLRLVTTRPPDLPALDVTAEMHLRDGHAAFTGKVARPPRVARPQGEAVDFSGGVVFAVSRQPFAVSIPKDGALSLHLQGDGRLEDLADVLPLGEDQLFGHYHVDLSIAGTIASPAVSGQATLDHGRYESLTYGTRLEGLVVDLEGDRDRIVLRRFTANDGDQGTVDMAGFVLPAAAGGPTLDATLHRFQLVHRDDSLGHGSGDIQVTGPLLRPQVTGRLTIDDAQLYLADRLPPSIRPLAVTVIDSATGQVLHTPPASPHHPPIVAVLDATIDIPGKFFIRGRGLDSEWTGHFAVGGSSDAPDIRGALKIAHGTLNFLGKPLDLTRGTITLTGGGKVEPLLDFLAQSSTGQFTAQVAVTGPAEQPTIKLTSDPPVPQDQVLSQLLFQHDITQLSPLEALQIAQAATDLTNGGPSVIDRIRMKVGLDRLSVGASQQTASTPFSTTTSPSSGSTTSNALGNTMVSGGKYVAPGVFVGVGQGLSGESQVTVEVEITRHLTVSGTQSDTTGSGVGVNWKLDY